MTFLAIDMPSPTRFAEQIDFFEPRVGRMIKDAFPDREGCYRVNVQAVDETLRKCRSLGLIEAAGANPPPHHVSLKRGFYLSVFGMSVMKELLVLEALR